MSAKDYPKTLFHPVLGGATLVVANKETEDRARKQGWTVTESKNVVNIEPAQVVAGDAPATGEAIDASKADEPGEPKQVTKSK